MMDMTKNSLNGFLIILKTKYVTNMSIMKSLTDSYIHDIDKTCEDCYYFKRMNEFTR